MDIVPHVPLKLMDFHHVPTEVWYYDHSDFSIGDGSGEDEMESDSNILDLSLPDHLTYLGVLYLFCP
jgi:hypothetical protein